SDGDRARHAYAGRAMYLAVKADHSRNGKGHGRRPGRAAGVAVSAGTIATVGTTKSCHRPRSRGHVVQAAAIPERNGVAGGNSEVVRRERKVGIRGHDVVRSGCTGRKRHAKRDDRPSDAHEAMAAAPGNGAMSFAGSEIVTADPRQLAHP